MNQQQFVITLNSYTYPLFFGTCELHLTPFLLSQSRDYSHLPRFCFLSSKMFDNCIIEVNRMTFCTELFISVSSVCGSSII